MRELQDRLYAVHDPGGAVALVQTGDPHVRVYRENRPVAVSDDAGEALVTGLSPYAPNHIGVEPRDYSFDTLVEKTDMTVTPRPRSGVTVNLKPVSHHPLLVLVQAEGRRVALEVDSLVGRQQVVVKNLELNYRKVPGVSGATIMGDGSVALILDAAALVRSVDGTV